MDFSLSHTYRLHFIGTSTVYILSEINSAFYALMTNVPKIKPSAKFFWEIIYTLKLKEVQYFNCVSIFFFLF